jgi:DHA2 family multidrug resistance protein
MGLKSKETPTRKLPIDRIGLMLLFFWVGMLQVMLDLGKDADWVHSALIVVMAVMAGIGFLAWTIWEMTDAHPIVDLSLFANRNFLLGTISLCLGYSVFFANTLILPLWLQTQLGYTATWAGLAAAPSGAVAVLLTPFAARLSGKVDARWLGTVALVSFGISYYLRSEFTTSVSFWQLVIPMLVQGIAMATFFLAMVTIALDGIPAAKLPSATGISNFARITASSFTASIITTAWDRREALHQSRLSEAVGNGQQLHTAIGVLNRAGLTDLQAVAAISRQALGQAYLLASTDLFRLSAWLSFALVLTVWLARRPAPPSGPVAAD